MQPAVQPTVQPATVFKGSAGTGSSPAITKCHGPAGTECSSEDGNAYGSAGHINKRRITSVPNQLDANVSGDFPTPENIRELLGRENDSNINFETASLQ